MRYLFLTVSLALVVTIGGGCGKQAKKERYLSQANRDFAAEQYDRAEVNYVNVLKLVPLEPESITRLGLIYHTEGRLPQAYAFLKKAVELQPENLEARVKLGLTCLSFRNLKEAREQALTVLEKQPGNEEAFLLLANSVSNSAEIPQVVSLLESFGKKKDTAGYHVALATLYTREQETEKAEAEIKQALALDPKSSAAYQGLAAVYLMRKDLKQGEAAFKAAADLSPLRSPRRLFYAGFRVDAGATEDGKKILEEITSKAPDYVPAWTMLAQIAFAEGKYDDCSALLKRVGVRDPANYDALLLNGKLMLAKGERTNAIAQFERVISLYGPSPKAELELARAHLVNGDVNKCVTSLRTALASEPDLADALLMLADINLQRGESATAIQDLTQLVRRQPQVVEAHLALAEAYAAQKNFDESSAVLRRMIPLFPENQRVHYLLGTILLEQKKQAEARQAFEKSLKLSPDYLPALEQIVNLDLMDKQYELARKRVKSQMEKQPKSAVPWLLLGKINLVQGNGAETETAFLKAAELEPELRNPYMLLAQLYRSSNQPQNALQILNKLLAIHTNDVPALMQIGMIQTGLANFAAARDAYEKLLAMEPKSTIALNNLAALYSERLGQLDKGLELARRARELAPEDPASADTLGWIFYQKGEHGKALSLLRESAAKLPGDPEVQFHLGMACYMMGDEEKARAALQPAANAEKDFPGKAEASRRLALLAIDVTTANAETVAELEKEVRDDPKDAVALRKLAAIQERDEAFEKAAKTYEKVLELNPQNVQVMDRLARLYDDHLNQRAKALEWAKQAHSLEPDKAGISHLLGQLAYETGDYKWALSLLQEAAREMPEPRVQFDLAWAYYGVGRADEAEAALRNILQKEGGGLRAEDGGVFENARLFLSMIDAGKNPVKAKEAGEQMRQILATRPNYIPALMVSALAEEAQGRPESARRVYESILVGTPSFAPATRNLAILCTQHFPDDTEAYEMALKAREAYPEDPKVSRALGILVYRRAKGREDFERSAQLLKASAGTLTEDAELMYYLGMAQYQIKDKESRKALERALVLNVEPGLAERARRAIAEMNYSVLHK